MPPEEPNQLPAADPVTDYQVRLTAQELQQLSSLVKETRDTLNTIRDTTLPQMSDSIASLREWKREMNEHKEAVKSKFKDNEQEHKELSKQVWISIGAQAVLLTIALVIFKVK